MSILVEDRMLEALLPEDEDDMPECTCYRTTMAETTTDAQRVPVRVRNPLCERHKNDPTVVEKIGGGG